MARATVERMQSPFLRLRPHSTIDALRNLFPGIALAASIGGIAYLLQLLEVRLIGYALIEALVIAIFLGIGWRNLRGVSPFQRPGVDVSAKQLLELAIVLLGASVDLPTLLAAGPLLLGAVLIAVTGGIATSLLIGRSLGLNPQLALLVAVGNSICGNSAISAVAPVIKASKADVASAIALTAILGVVVVLTLPVAIPLFGLDFYQYGVLAGLTVYAVPQVLAATFPVSALSGEVGTLVKLVRVLLLGPVVLTCALCYRAAGSVRPPLSRLVPWFIGGFLLLAVARSSGLLGDEIAQGLREISRWLTIIAMAALGLGVDLRTLRNVGVRVGTAVIASLVVLIGVSLLLIHGLGISG